MLPGPGDGCSRSASLSDGQDVLFCSGVAKYKNLQPWLASDDREREDREDEMGSDERAVRRTEGKI